MKTYHCLARTPVSVVSVLIGLGAWSARAQPANDMFANRVAITGATTTVTGSNVGATREPGEPDHGWNAGGASVWWSWTAPFDGFARISTAGSSFDTTLGVYTGSSVSALNRIAADDDEDYYGGIYTSEAWTDVAAGQTYQIAVDGYDGASGSVRLQIVWEPFPLAPVWVEYDPYGVPVHSSDFADKVIIFDFWASWCGPCRAEIPDYVFLQDKYRADGLVIIGATIWDALPDTLAFLSTSVPPLNYQVIIGDDALGDAFGGIDAIPTTFIIDRQNIIRNKYVGTQPLSTFEDAIIPLLYGDTRLSCQLNANQMLLQWRDTATPFTLERSTHPTGARWFPWPIAPIVVDGTNTISIQTTEWPRFFRLKMSY